MNTQSMKLSLSKAIEYYNSGNETLKYIALKGFTAKQLTTNTEETIDITLEEAKEYYNSDNEEVKLLATKAFPIDKLKQETYDDIIKKLFLRKQVFFPSDSPIFDKYTLNVDSYIPESPTNSQYFETKDIRILRYMAVIIKLRNIAEYLNEKINVENGYTIVGEQTLIIKDTHYEIMNHPVVFEKLKHAEMAIKMLTEEEKSWFINVNN